MTSLYNNSVISQALSWTCGIGGVISNMYVMATCIRNYRYQAKTILRISEASRYNSTTSSPDIPVRKRTKLGKVATLFFANLSLADMLSCLYLMILAIAEANSDNTSKSYLIYANQSIRIYVNRTLVHYQLDRWKNSFLCQVLRLLNITGTTASVWITLMIAIDRFIMIVYPLQLNRKFTLRRAAWACRIIWLYACICGSLTVILAQLTVLPDDSWYSRLCLIDNLDNEYVVAFAAYITVNSLLIYVAVSILIFYSLHCIRKSSIRVTNSRNIPYPTNCRQQRAETNLTITSVIVITNILCWLPTTVISLLFALGVQYIGTILFALNGTFITLLYPANGFINPLVFIILNRVTHIKR